MAKIAVLGCGLLGTKIAGEMAYHGHRVTMYDSNVETLNSVFDRLNEDKQSLREEGLLATNNFVGEILCFRELEETLRGAEFVFEAVVDNMQVKQQLFEKVSAYASSDAILATNTLNLDVNQVFEKVTGKERTVGLRFVFPVYCIPEVEITCNSYTDEGVIDKVRRFMDRMGKKMSSRSSQNEPLILSEEQCESRKQARRHEIYNASAMGFSAQSAQPALSHHSNQIHPTEGRHADKTNSNRDQECAVCMDRMRDCLICPCHHMVTCSQCAKVLQNRNDSCPVCRHPITEIIRVFHS